MSILTLHLKSPKRIRELAAELCRAFGFESFSEHESVNYSNGGYFAGGNENLSFKLSFEDTVGFDDYQFECTCTSLAQSFSEAEMDQILQTAVSISPRVAIQKSYNRHEVVREVLWREGAGALSRLQETIPRMRF